MNLLHATREGASPTHLDLVVEGLGDPTWWLWLRDRKVDGSLVPVTQGPVELLVRHDRTADVAQAQRHDVTDGLLDNGVLEVRIGLGNMPFGEVAYQLDVLASGRRETFCHGWIVREDVLPRDRPEPGRPTVRANPEGGRR